MTEKLQCSSLERDVTRYAYGSDLGPDDKRFIEEHLQSCAECRELVAFIRQSLSVAQTKSAARPNAPTPECLDADTIALLEEDGLPWMIADRAREHILNCARCRDRYLLWCRMNTEEGSPVAETVTEAPDKRVVNDAVASGVLTDEAQRRLDVLLHKSYLTDAEKIEALQLRKLKLRLKDLEIEREQQKDVHKKGRFA
jgi:anti-sigma factor RsiW